MKRSFAGSVRAVPGCLSFQPSFHFLWEAFSESPKLGTNDQVAFGMYFCPTTVALAYLTVSPTGQWAPSGWPLHSRYLVKGYTHNTCSYNNLNRQCTGNKCLLKEYDGNSKEKLFSVWVNGNIGLYNYHCFPPKSNLALKASILLFTPAWADTVKVPFIEGLLCARHNIHLRSLILTIFLWSWFYFCFAYGKKMKSEF